MNRADEQSQSLSLSLSLSLSSLIHTNSVFVWLSVMKQCCSCLQFELIMGKVILFEAPVYNQTTNAHTEKNVNIGD